MNVVQNVWMTKINFSMTLNSIHDLNCDCEWATPMGLFYEGLRKSIQYLVPEVKKARASRLLYTYPSILISAQSNSSKLLYILEIPSYPPISPPSGAVISPFLYVPHFWGLYGEGKASSVEKGWWGWLSNNYCKLWVMIFHDNSATIITQSQKY